MRAAKVWPGTKSDIKEKIGFVDLPSQDDEAVG
jgi:hypothetical protein